MNGYMNNAISDKNFLSSNLKRLAKRHFSLVDGQANLISADLKKNELLAALPSGELAFLLPHLELVQLPVGRELFEYGAKLTHVYFPTTCVIGLQYMLADGASLEIGVTGREGLLGVFALMGGHALATAKVQCEGNAYRLPASVLQEAYAAGGKLQSLLMGYLQALFSQMTQNSVSGRHYSVGRQLSRWILERMDRLQINQLKITQEMISSMLGVRRESITEAAGKLQAKGLIQYRRGCIEVLDRAGLELHAGECYATEKHEFDLFRTSMAN